MFSSRKSCVYTSMTTSLANPRNTRRMGVGELLSFMEKERSTLSQPMAEQEMTKVKSKLPLLSQNLGRAPMKKTYMEGKGCQIKHLNT